MAHRQRDHVDELPPTAARFVLPRGFESLADTRLVFRAALLRARATGPVLPAAVDAHRLVRAAALDTAAAGVARLDATRVRPAEATDPRQRVLALPAS